MTTNTTNPFIAVPFDWTRVSATASQQGKHEFETTVANCDGLEKDQLQDIAKELKERDERAFELTKNQRRDPEPMFLSSVRNWSRHQAIRLLSTKKAGQPIRKDYQDVFEGMLKEEITTRITELELAWQAEEEQKKQQVALNRRLEQERAFQDDHQPLVSAYSALEKAYVGREQAVQAGYHLAQQYAEQLGERMGRHEHYIEHMGKVVLGMMQTTAHRQQKSWEVPWGCITLVVAIALPLLALFVWNLILK